MLGKKTMNSNFSFVKNNLEEGMRDLGAWEWQQKTRGVKNTHCWKMIKNKRQQRTEVRRLGLKMYRTKSLSFCGMQAGEWFWRLVWNSGVQRRQMEVKLDGASPRRAQQSERLNVCNMQTG